MIEIFLIKSLDAQSAPGMSYFSFKLQKCPIFKVLNLKNENFNDFNDIINFFQGLCSIGYKSVNRR